jgi:ArsR family transcriptional regulator, arsenate/arsenite/antimonite-responsive transcriptional repressor
MSKLTESLAVEQLGALGNETRLRLLRLLVRAGPEGLNIGQIRQQMQAPASTLAHHIATLARAGLIGQERRGREIISTARYDAIQALGAYLMEDCCRGAVLSCGDSAA